MKIMEIVVCIKQVPEITNVKLDPVTHTLVRDGVQSIVNPFDEFAVEEALRIKEKFGGSVTVMTMGPPQAREALLKCLAMGADRAVHLCDRAFAGSDTWATSLILASAIKTMMTTTTMKFDIVFCGKQAIDGDTAQVGPEVAELLGIPQVTYVKKVIVENDGKVTVHRETEEGYEVLEARLPVLLTAIKGLNEPRIPSIMGIMSAKKKEIKTVTAADLPGLEKGKTGIEGSPTNVVRVFPPRARGAGVVLKDLDSSGAAKSILDFLGERKAL